MHRAAKSVYIFHKYTVTALKLLTKIFKESLEVHELDLNETQVGREYYNHNNINSGIQMSILTLISHTSRKFETKTVYIVKFIYYPVGHT